jgi:hypothetical protein
MSPTYWGPAVWRLLHTLVSAISDEGFALLRLQIYQLIYKISSLLPCPECAQHSISFLNQIKVDSIKTKPDLKHMMYIYHNAVNTKLKKPLYNISNINVYDNVSIIDAFNKFVSVFNTHNVRLMSENLQRKSLVNYLHSWIIKHLKYYIQLSLYNPPTKQNVIVNNITPAPQVVILAVPEPKPKPVEVILEPEPKPVEVIPEPVEVITEPELEPEPVDVIPESEPEPFDVIPEPEPEPVEVIQETSPIELVSETNTSIKPKKRAGRPRKI